MPELPEMENYRRLLKPLAAGKTVLSAKITREKSVNLPAETFAGAVAYQRITAVERRAKYLLFHLESSHVLLLHLMLNGWIYYTEGEEAPERTAQVELDLETGRLFFLGLRLGFLHYLSAFETSEKLRPLGPEPMEESFNLEHFQSRLNAKSRSVLKSALTDQRVIAGIGNCYSDEICFAAGILPYRKIHTLSLDESGRLFAAMKQVLSEAVNAGGYMEVPLYAGDKLTGGYDSRCAVYDRADEPCLRCGHPIGKREIASRKTFCCTNCQQ
ncbi:Fpg/Nei family DNA glycosylase [Ferviditalea candida]|uniref:Formamidopyrimidine-DNA glycosylase n=1 Tax=Ferviditalea candida TaxID=3108399 RepID=A0ABU5ZJL0_9BACL|nr:DNA-formamidopyrimidine glycosylase family protein [Paenibacillaceae bacterium T2]